MTLRKDSFLSKKDPVEYIIPYSIIISCLTEHIDEVLQKQFSIGRRLTVVFPSDIGTTIPVDVAHKYVSVGWHIDHYPSDSSYTLVFE